MSQGTETHEDQVWKIRHVKMPTTLWVAAARKANAEGVSISHVVRRLLEAYVRGDIEV